MRSASVSPNRTSPQSPSQGRRSLANLEALGSQPDLLRRGRSTSAADRAVAVRAVEVAVTRALTKKQASNVPESVSPESEADTGAAVVAYEPSPFAGPLEPEIPVHAPAQKPAGPASGSSSPDTITGVEALEAATADWYQNSSEVASSAGEAATSVFHIGTPTLAPASSQPSLEVPKGAAVPPIPEEDLGEIGPASPGRRAGAASSQVLKLIVLGDASVGKTALIQRFVNGSFQALPYKPTVGADFYSQKLEYTSKATGEKTGITLQIWDTYVLLLFVLYFYQIVRARSGTKVWRHRSTEGRTCA